MALDLTNIRLDGPAAEAAIGELASAHGLGVVRWPGATHRSARASARFDAYEIRVKLQSGLGATVVEVPGSEMLVGPGEASGALGRRLGEVAAKLRAAALLEILDGARPLDFAGAEGESALERTERAAVRLAELSEGLMREAAKMRQAGG